MSEIEHDMSLATFDVLMRTIFAGATEFGAAWKKTARETQREYLSVKLDDPSFPAPIYASLVEAEDGSGHNLIWSRRNGD